MNPNTPRNRRLERRYHFAAGMPLQWKREGKSGARTRRAWLNNASVSGISFLVEGPQRPHVGQAVNIWRAEPSRGTLYRVVRVHSEDGDVYTIGCRKEHATRCAINRPREREDSIAIRQITRKRCRVTRQSAAA